MAFEAPGALGCEKPADVLRRSDRRAGWEYAEAEGRAVGIRRLVGYDYQRASLPFLGQSNINLAYSYSEQPMLHESQANVEARCLASASLVRPMAFDPAVEFAGIHVETEAHELFRVALPDGTQASVAPGETTPKRVKVNGHDVEGSRLRYIRISKDRHEINGLGITQISGVVAFYEPAVFGLKKTPQGDVYLTSNTGASIERQWLHGEARCIEVLSCENQWLDITHQCQAGSIPTPLVKEWADRNQHTLIRFRIRP
jgi:hypothetical protein